MDDTAQPLAAAETDPNAQLQEAANAFKALENPSQPRDERGKFAREPEQTEETAKTEEDDEPEADEAGGEESDEVEADEADEEAAEPAQPMPPSWGAEDTELWASLPPEAQARIAVREGERDRGLNLKLQESANARKQAELAAKEAQSRREEYLTALETVKALYETPEPDPRSFGYGTQQYNEAAYLAAHRQWRENAQALAQLSEQREAVRKQAEDEEADSFKSWKQQHEAEYAPKLLADVPELKAPEKAEPLLRGLFQYAIQSGIPEDVFAEDAQDQITSAQLHILWKAQQFDKVRASKTAPKPKPQPGPAVKPGVSSPRSAQKNARYQKASERLAREGTVEAAAAVFKHIL